MKLVIFLLSFSGFVAAAYFLIRELGVKHDFNQLIYTVLLAIIVCKSIVGMVITSCDILDNHRKISYYR